VAIMRRIFVLILRPVYFASVILLLKLQGMKRKRWGNCSFWGTEDFLKLCDQSLYELKDLDSRLFNELIGHRKLHFYFSNKPSEQISNAGVYSLNDRFCNWGTKGVIARLVYAYHTSALMQNRTFSHDEKPLRDNLRARAKEETRFWLTTHNFPSKLEECFR